MILRVIFIHHQIALAYHFSNLRWLFLFLEGHERTLILSVLAIFNNTDFTCTIFSNLLYKVCDYMIVRYRILLENRYTYWKKQIFVAQ